MYVRMRYYFNSWLIIDALVFTGWTKDHCPRCPSAATSCPDEWRGRTTTRGLKALNSILRDPLLLNLAPGTEMERWDRQPRRRHTSNQHGPRYWRKVWKRPRKRKGKLKTTSTNAQGGWREPIYLCILNRKTSDDLCVYLSIVRLKCVGPPLGQ